VYDTQRETMASLNAGTATEEAPIWTPDGARIVYSSDRDGQTTPHLYWKRVDGGAEERLTDVKHSEREVAGSFTPDGRTLLYSALDEAGAQSKWDVFALRLEGSDAGGWKPQAPVPLLHESFDEVQPALSPDGRWLAYVSNESGKPEVYVRRYPELDHRKMVSNAGGSWPTWSRDTKELFFTLGGHAMVVGYTGGAAGFDATRPRQWSSGSIATVEGARNFDVHPSGQKLLAFRMGNQPTDAGHDKAVLVFGLFDELRRLTHGRN
jgi:Tol biopolymer transport system component